MNKKSFFKSVWNPLVGGQRFELLIPNKSIDSDLPSFFNQLALQDAAWHACPRG